MALEELITGLPQDEQKARAVAAALRGEQDAASVLSMSTVAPVSRMASDTQDRMAKEALRAGTLRESRKRSDDTQSWRSAQVANTDARNKVLDARNAAQRTEDMAVAEQASLAKTRKAELDRGLEREKMRGLAKAKQARLDWDMQKDKTKAGREAEKAAAEDKDRLKEASRTVDEVAKGIDVKSMSVAERTKYRTFKADMKAVEKIYEDLATGKYDDAFGFGTSTSSWLGDDGEFMNAVGKTFDNWRLEPEDKTMRAKVYKGAYETINRLAGAVLSAGEVPRITPFVADSNDNVETIKAKLAATLEETQATLDSFESMYTPGAGAGVAGGMVGKKIGNVTITQELYDQLTEPEKEKLKRKLNGN